MARGYWHDALAPYGRPSLPRSLLDIATSVVPYLALSWVMYLLLSSSYVLSLLIAVPAAGFLLRTYVVFHDCTHGSLLPSRRANVWLGVAMGLVVYTPFHSWRHSHAVHHATFGDLDRRGVGDVHTLTVSEYAALPARRRFAYRLFRNPVVMFGLGPLWALVIQPRFVPRGARQGVRRSVIATNIALVAIVASLCWVIGWQRFLLVQVPTAWLAGAAGIFLFFVQHQFEDTYWQSSDKWSYADAALQGSSHLKLPKLLRFFSGNIGVHHVHHLSVRIPNYKLQQAHDANAFFHDVPTLSLGDAIRTVRLKLWDEDRARLVTWRQARDGARSA